MIIILIIILLYYDYYSYYYYIIIIIIIIIKSIDNIYYSIEIHINKIKIPFLQNLFINISIRNKGVGDI